MQPAPAPAPAATPAPDTVLATIDGQPITEADLELALSDLDQQFARLPAEQRRAAAMSAIIEIRLLAAKAVADGIDKTADVPAADRIPARSVRCIASWSPPRSPPRSPTQEIRARYDQEVANTPPVNEVHARHILVKTKEEATDIIKQLDGGAKFEDIAKEKSSDGSAGQGGDLGWFGPGQMVPEFEKAAFALEVGSYTKEPVQTQFGWHVIKVEDKRAKQPPAFEQVKDQVRSVLLRDKYFALVKSARDAAKVEISDAELKKGVDALEKSQ